MRKLRVKVQRTFNRYNAGDELIVEETKDVKGEVKSGLLVVVAVEDDPKSTKAAASKSTKADA